MTSTLDDHQRIVITGIGLTAPNGNSLPEFRDALLNGRSGVQKYDIRYVGETLAGICDFDELKYQKKKEVRRGTRAGSIGIYCAQEAVADSGLDWANLDRERVGVYIGVTEHGNVETENEIYEIKGYDYDTSVWSHHHNPRTVANNPAGEITLNMGITGPHYTIGAACAAGNAGLIQGAQMLRLGECDVALAGGVSESIRTFGIFAGFASQGALAKHEDPTKASRPFDMDRNGIVVSEGGCIYVLERFDDAQRRGAKIYGELVGYAMNSDASDFVLPNPSQQARCMEMALEQRAAQRGGHRPREHARHGHRQRRHPGVRRTAASVSQRRAAGREQHEELHRPRDGGGRGAGAGRQLAGVRRRRVPPDDQRRPARSGMRTARAWRSTSPASGKASAISSTTRLVCWGLIRW